MDVQITYQYQHASMHLSFEVRNALELDVGVQYPEYCMPGTCTRYQVLVHGTTYKYYTCAGQITNTPSSEYQ